MTGDLSNAVIPAVYIGTPVTGGNDPHEILFFDTGFFYCLIQTLLCTHHCSATCRNDHSGFDFPVLIQNNNVCTGRTTVDSGYIVNS